MGPRLLVRRRSGYQQRHWMPSNYRLTKANLTKDELKGDEIESMNIRQRSEVTYPHCDLASKVEKGVRLLKVTFFPAHAVIDAHEVQDLRNLVNELVLRGTGFTYFNCDDRLSAQDGLKG